MARFHANKLIDLIFLLALSVVLTLPAFLPRVLALSWDGVLHMGRFTQIALAFQHGTLPSMISFIGEGKYLTAMIGMYPWMADLILILPLAIINSKIIALVIGYVILNFITGFNIYLLMGSLTKRRLLKFLGVVLYLFNGYHILDLYVRVEWGEVVAYAFFPLVILGLYDIWQKKKDGTLFLSMGMIGIANSHFLSLLAVVIIITVIELYRFIRHRVFLNEIKSLIKSAIISILGSLYSLLQFFHIIIGTKLFTPIKAVNQVSISASMSALIHNRMSEAFQTWHIGLVLVIIFLFLLIELIRSKGKFERYDYYTVAAFFSLLLVFEIFHDNLVQKKWIVNTIGNFQMTGRFLIFTVLMIIIAFVIYCDLNHTNRKVIWLVMLITIGMSMFATHNYIKGTDINRYPVSSKTWNNVIESIPEFFDYIPKQMADKVYPTQQDVSSGVKVTKVASNYNSATYLIKAKKNIVQLPIACYSNIKYQIKINGKNAKYSSRDSELVVKLPKKESHLYITNSLSIGWYPIFFLSLIVNIILAVMLIVYYFRLETE
ncbi:hypothetical protein AYI71_01885 [Limosilactobacillus oris]|nr:hypothetical protein AYI71_01885 [Limosilactobacillus oris]